MPYYNRDPKRDHNFDNHPSVGFKPLYFRLSDFFLVASTLWVCGGRRRALKACCYERAQLLGGDSRDDRNLCPS